jgi:plasmid stabilization system protein ParE
VRVLFQPGAADDLLQIEAWLDSQRPGAGRRIARKIVQKCERLAAHPWIGRQREALASGLRSISEKPYVIFYRIDADVVVVMIAHGARDLDRLVRERLSET